MDFEISTGLNIDISYQSEEQFDSEVIIDEELSIDISDSEETIEITDESVVIDFDIFDMSEQEKEIYEGDYKVTPKVDSIILDTKDKIMYDDVTIYQIPYSAVSNPAGGTTVTIGIE